ALSGPTIRPSTVIPSASMSPSTSPLGPTVQCSDWMLPRNVPSILISPSVVIFPSNTVSAAIVEAGAIALGCGALSLDGGFLRLNNIEEPDCCGGLLIPTSCHPLV